MEGSNKSDGEMIMSPEKSDAPSINDSNITAEEKAALRGEVRPVSSSPEEEANKEEAGGAKSLSVSTTAVVVGNASLNNATIEGGTKNDDANNIKNDKVKKGVDNTHMTLKNTAVGSTTTSDSSSVIGSAISSSVNTTALQLLGGTKKRKRKATSTITKSITKKKVLSSFQEDDDDEGSGNKRMMDEFLASAVVNTTNSDGGEGADVDDEEGGGDDHAENDEGKLPPEKLAAENSNTNNVAATANNNEKEESNSPPSSIQHTNHTHEGVIPPDRAMSPMPQTERENVPVCHSPNVPDVTNTTTAVNTNASAAAATSLSAGGTAAVANNSAGLSSVGITTSNINKNNNNLGEHNQSIPNTMGGGGGRLTTTIRMQQQNNIGQMRLLQQQQQQQQQASQQLAQRFSSSNSSGDGKGATNTTANTMNTSLQSQQQTQPPGWRVKLYRLNMDGTWDDCGTGRIQFYYARGTSGGEGIKGGAVGEGEGHLQPQQLQQQQQQLHGGKLMSGGEGKKQPPVLKNLFRELGEPMLCMRAELSQKQQQQGGNPNINAENKNTFAGNNNNNEGGGPSSSSGEKVLLRTRVLLHEAYQCQGGNIITWCEPFHAHGKKDKVDATASSSSSSSNPLSARPQQQQQQGGDSTPAASSSPAGVDLALSFQDNAGCKDIWQHILNVQSCAREMTTHFANNNNTSLSSSSSSSMSIHSPLSPIKVTTSSTHAHPLHNSPNSPDHDYVEDKLIAGGGGGGGTPLVGGISSRPSIWTNKDSNSIGNSSSSSSSSSTNVENRLHSHNHALPSNKSPYSSSSPSSSDDDEEEKQFHDAVDHMTAVSMAAAAAASYKLSPKDGNASGGGGGGMDNTNVSSPLSMGGGVGGGGGGGGTLHGFHMNNNNSHLDNTNAVGGVSSPLQLPKSPTWDDLQNIGDVIAGVHLHQREDFLIFLSQSDCAYIKLLLNLFPPAEGRGEDMTELAVIIKTILLLNDPEIIEYVTSDAPTFESVCAVLEYDPELREKANHREFIRKCAKFRTVVKMEDDELVSQIHHLFRVTYLRDNVLRPTMDESSLSTLVSLAQFTQSDIIKGVITAPKVKVAGAGGVASELPGLSYLTKVVRLLAVEIDAIRTVISGEDESNAADPLCQNQPIQEESGGATMWQQHLAPQDSSLSSRHNRRKGCLMFLKELFCKARVSLQQPEKDEFIESCVSNSKLLYLLGAILSDPNVGVDEQGAALEMVSVVAMHDPCVIRRHCLQGAGTAAESSSNEMFSCLRPDPNDHREVIFICPPNDLLLSILFVMSTATDAGILLQTSEIIRIILDTDIVGGDQGTSLNGSFMNEENDINALNSQNIRHDTGSEEQNSFLALFYDRYIQWLVAPFQYKMFISKSILPLLSESNRDESFSAINRTRQEFKHCSASEEKSLTSVAGCAVRSSFTLEILSFCVRAHVYRMKFFILRTRLLGTILKMLCQKAPHPHQMSSGGKCLKLASLKFLRSVLSVKDEFYHRHIVQYNLFAPVFDAFRITPVGRNLISSAVLEMCDFIRTENIKSLLEYIVTKHLTKSASPGEKSLEDIANPHVDTFAQLRRTHEENIGMHLDPNNEEGNPGNDGATFNGRPAPVINKKALEDQRKYREAESEDSYFNDDDDDDEVMGPLPNDENSSSLPPMSDTASLLADVSSLE